LVTSASERSEGGEEGVRDTEAKLAHGVGRDEAKASVGDLEVGARDMLVPSLLQMLRRNIVEQMAAGVGGSIGGRGSIQVVGDSVASSPHAHALGATTNVFARGCGIRWHTVDVQTISGQALDSQTLSGAEATNATDASAGVVDVARRACESRARTIDGVTAALGIARSGVQELGTTEVRASHDIDCTPGERGARRRRQHGRDRIEQATDRLRWTGDGVARSRSEGASS
jgi:hypothetical protein